MNRLQHSLMLAVALAFSLPAHAAGTLIVEEGWIRNAPPGAPALAGYGVLRNGGDASLTIRSVSTEGFAESSLHESVLVGDVSRMQAIPELTLAAGQSVTLAPGGKHLMLINPAKPPQLSEVVTVRFQLSDGSSHEGRFTVRDAAEPRAHDNANHDHAGHDHKH